MRVLMLPQLKHFRSEESGIKRVVEAYHKHGPAFGIEFVGGGDQYDLKVSHAGTNTENIDVAMLHGLYWTADYPASSWEWKANANVIEAARQARIITVPSGWVAESVRRDMRRNPVIVGHGIDAAEWEHDRPMGGYVLWNKNRSGIDVCSPEAVGVLAGAFPAQRFVTTFAPQRKRRNIDTIGVIPHDQMKLLVQGASVYLSTIKETFCIGNLEAMASGVPILGYAHGGNLEMVQHGINGYLAEPWNEDDLIEGLAYCLKHRKTLGENGREMVKEFTWESVMEKVADVFQGAMKEESPTVAIIIPSYMYADKVGRAIESAVRQTYRQVKEIVVVDDGSQDDGATETVVKEWSQKDARIVYLRQENQGVAVARNNGIASTDAKYVCCLDADDAIEQEFIEKCVRELERDHSLGLVYTKIRHVLADGSTGVSPWPGEWDFDNQLQRRNQVPTCNVFRREVWSSLGGYKKRYCPIGAGSEDAEFWTRIGAHGWKCKLATAEPLFIYSLGTGRASGNKDYHEPDWLGWHPWVEDGQHPFASYATPKRWSHPVRQYDEPVVSVVIPVGPGHEEVVEDALDSVEGQTFRQWECLVVWDGTEPPQRLLDAYPHVRWLSIMGRTAGPGAARNLGAEYAKAPFLLFLDADDRLYFHAIERMLDEWESEEAIIYSDYVGKAFIEDVGQLSEKVRRGIQWREADGLTVIEYETPDYDVARAQRQPDGDPRKVYTWNLITSLVPKAWHGEIGGFDEGMASWEDVDYWWRLAKAGKCFRRVDEPLVVYHFYTGGRRDRGLEMHQELFQYLIDKHEREEVMPCRGCGGSKSRSAQVPQQQATPQTPLALQDDQFQLCVYNHPSRGQQTTIGQAVFDQRIEGVHMIRNHAGPGFRIHYGWRGGGEKFLVHVEDVRVAQHLYTPVEQRPAAPKAEKKAPEPPRALTEPEETFMEEEGAPPPAPQRIDLKQVISDTSIKGPAETTETYPIPIEVSDNGFDWQRLPGVTAKIAQKLEGLDLEDVLEMGEEGLQQIQYVGPSRAKAIFAAAKEAFIA
jgi:glycosyltransferase involved in cell wall biosynthesis